MAAYLSEYESTITISGFPEGQETGGFTVSFPIDEEEWVGNLTIEVYDAQDPRQSSSSVVTVQCAPAPGDYRIVMHDAYGDGWQTDDGNGGNGLLVVLSDGTEIEVGMCSPYLEGDYDCVEGDGYEAEDIVTIPEGGLYAVWSFPGDMYGEISFEIYSPTDEIVFQYAESDTYAGELPGFNCVR